MHGTHGNLVNMSTCGSHDGGILLVLRRRYHDFYSPICPQQHFSSAPRIYVGPRSSEEAV